MDPELPLDPEIKVMIETKGQAGITAETIVVEIAENQAEIDLRNHNKPLIDDRKDQLIVNMANILDQLVTDENPKN